MAEISLKIKSDFEQAQAAFKQLGTLSESAQKQLAKLQAQFEKGSIDKFIEKNKLNAAAITATRGSAAGLKAEYSGLQREIEKLIRKGLDPQSESLQKLKSRYQEIEGQLPRTQSQFSGLMGTAAKLGLTIGAAGIAYKMTEIGKASLKAASDMQQNTIAFETMLGSATAATTLMSDITKFAEKTPFQKEELVNYAKSMIGVGFATGEVIPTLEMLGNIAAGVGSEKLPNIIKAFDKMKGKGKASLEELWPIVEAGVPILDQLSADLGKTKDEVIKMATNGKLSFEQVNSSMKKVEVSKFNNLMGQISGTIGGQWSNFNDQLDRTAVLFGQAMLPAAQNTLGTMSALLGVANGLVAKYNEMNASATHYRGTLEVWNANLNDHFEKLGAIYEQGGALAKVAGIYYQYLHGDVQLSDKEIAQAQKLLQLNRSLAEIKGEVAKAGEKGATAKFKPPAMPKTGTGTKKTELEQFQENLKKMEQTEANSYAQRLKVAQDYFSQHLEAEQLHGEELAAWQEEQASLIANNTKLSFDQRIIAMEALSKAVKKKSESDIKNFAQFGGQIMGNASSMFQDLITTMNNAGKSSKAFAIGLKITSAAEAAINSYLAFTQVLRDPTIWPSWLRLPLAGTILAAGLAKQAAIWSTPIAETGLSNYEVPDVRQFRNDNYAVRAQAGETVTVTPKGEDAGGSISANISIGEKQVFRVIQKGAKSGKINVNNKNIRRGVFAH